ncbi:MAG: metallophosphoesterase family protein [Candidatus Anstonellales archaeon]
MKVAFLSDTHIGERRFRKEALDNATKVIEAAKVANIIFHCGDFFDTRYPKPEVVAEIARELKRIGKKVYAIYGNHERVPRDSLTELQLLAELGVVEFLKSGRNVIEHSGMKIVVYALNNVPEDLAKAALEEVLRGAKCDGDLNILLLHQDIKEFVMSDTEGAIELADLEGLCFDLIVSGHIHQHRKALGGKLVVTGSTIATQLKKEDEGPKGFVLYDTEKKQWEFIDPGLRKFQLVELEFEEATENDVFEKVAEKMALIDEGALVRIKLEGTLRKGEDGAKIVARIARQWPFVYEIDSRLTFPDIKEKIQLIRKGREGGGIAEGIEGVVSRNAEKAGFAYDSRKAFEKATESSDELVKYVKEEEGL